MSSLKSVNVARHDKRRLRRSGVAWGARQSCVDGTRFQSRVLRNLWPERPQVSTGTMQGMRSGLRPTLLERCSTLQTRKIRAKADHDFRRRWGAPSALHDSEQAFRLDPLMLGSKIRRQALSEGDAGNLAPLPRDFFGRVLRPPLPGDGLGYVSWKRMGALLPRTSGARPALPHAPPIIGDPIHCGRPLANCARSTSISCRSSSCGILGGPPNRRGSADPITHQCRELVGGSARLRSVRVFPSPSVGTVPLV
jgi:hypothetical protein